MKKLSDIKGKRILYVATKNSDYLRLVQEIRLLKENGNDVTVISSASKSYFKRIMYVYRRLLKADMKDYDISFIGFAPQLVIPVFRRKLKKKRFLTIRKNLQTRFRRQLIPAILRNLKKSLLKLILTFAKSTEFLFCITRFRKKAF